MFCCKVRKSDKVYEDIPDNFKGFEKICNRCGNNANNTSLCSLCMDVAIHSIDPIHKHRLCIRCDVDISYLPESYRTCRKCFPSPNFCITCRKPILMTKSYCHECNKIATGGSL